MTTGKGVAADTGDENGSIGVSRPAWLFSNGEKQQGPTVDGDSLPPDDAFEILRNPRRRHALRILARRDGTIGLTDLASEVASIENDKRPDDVSSAERKRVYISLYQCHVSKMVEAGTIEYDADTRVVEITPWGADLAEVLESFEADTDDRLPLYPLVAVAAFGLSIASFYGSFAGVAMLFLGVGVSFSVISYHCTDVRSRL